ncbi:MAG: metallophosphoesterase [Microthrixaceae bacterium]|nr:metallophosphoesterase [Microthrixaceae bacterium]
MITLVVLPLVFRATARLGPGEFSFGFAPSTRGETEIALAPLGSLSAPTHAPPIKVKIALQEVDVIDAIGSASDGGAKDLEAQIRDDLPGAMVQVLLRLAAISALVGAGAALAFPGRRSPVRLLSGSIVSILATAAMIAPVVMTYSPDQLLSSPQLRGQLATSDSLISKVAGLDTRFGSIESRADVLSSRIADLYSSATTKEISRAQGEVVILHVSDLHLSGVGLSLAKDLAEKFKVDAVVDTGDFTSFGFQPEAGFTDQLRGFKVPYYLVPGNHDSPEVRSELKRSPYIHYVDNELFTVKGLRILGMADPTNTALKTIPKPRIDETYRKQFKTTASLIQSKNPDVIAVHNPVQLKPALGKVAVAIAGHLHLFKLEVIDGTIVAVVGSSGATGIGNLLVDKSQPHRFELLRFTDRKLVAIDQIEVKADGGDFTLKRIMIRPDSPNTSDELPQPSSEEPSREQVQNEDPRVLDSVTSTTEPDPSGSTTIDSESTSTTSPGD